MVVKVAIANVFVRNWNAVHCADAGNTVRTLVSREMESIIKDRIVRFLESSEFFSRYQHGFVKDDPA